MKANRFKNFANAQTKATVNNNFATIKQNINNLKQIKMTKESTELSIQDQIIALVKENEKMTTKQIADALKISTKTALTYMQSLESNAIFESSKEGLVVFYSIKGEAKKEVIKKETTKAKKAPIKSVKAKAVKKVVAKKEVKKPVKIEKKVVDEAKPVIEKEIENTTPEVAKIAKVKPIKEKVKGEKKIGVIQTVINFVKENQFDKEIILKKLIELFPEKAESGMKTSLNCLINNKGELSAKGKIFLK
jgi:hypothetical protein